MNTITNVKIGRINNIRLQRTANIQSAMADFKINIQNEINTYTQARNDFENRESSKLNNLVREIEKIDFTGVAESVTFETKERNEKLHEICEKVKILKDKIDDIELKSTNNNVILEQNETSVPSIYNEHKTENNKTKSRRKEWENQITEKEREITDYKARECINLKEIARLNELVKEHQEKSIRLIEIKDKKVLLVLQPRHKITGETSIVKIITTSKHVQKSWTYSCYLIPTENILTRK